MSKKNKVAKSKLSASEKDLGKKRVYLLLGMIAVGMAIAIYRLNTY